MSAFHEKPLFPWQLLEGNDSEEELRREMKVAEEKDWGLGLDLEG